MNIDNNSMLKVLNEIYENAAALKGVKGVGALGGRIDELDLLISRLDNRQWRDELQTIWGGLEDVYAAMLDQERAECTEPEAAALEGTLEKLFDTLARFRAQLDED